MMNYQRLEKEGRLLVLPEPGHCEACILQCGDCGSCVIFGYYKGAADDCIRERKRILELMSVEFSDDCRREEVGNE